MNDSIRYRLRVLTVPLSIVAVLMVVTPAFDLLASVWPVQAGSVYWRFGAAGLLSGFLLTPLLGLAIATGVAATVYRSSALLAVGSVCLLGTIAVAALVPLLALDFLQLRGSVPPAEQALFDSAALKAFVKAGTSAIGLALLATANLRLWRAAANEQRRRSDLPTPVVMAPRIAVAESAARR
jgi:hypothetical protein